MADQLFRVSFHFNYSNEGYSEQWWLTGVSLGGIAPKIQAYLNLRLGWQPPEVTLGGVRVAIEGQSRKGRTLFGGANDPETPAGDSIILPVKGTFVLSGNKWDLNQLAMQCEVISGGQKMGFRYFGIIPDSVSGTGAEPLVFDAQPDWATAWKLWRNRVLADGWQIRSTQATLGIIGGLARPEIPIQSWGLSAAAPADWNITFQAAAAPAGWVPGAQVVVRGARMKYSGVKSPNGKWYISALPTPTQAGTVVATLRGTAGLSLGYLSNTGVVYLYGTSYVAPSNISPYSVTKHKRGGPFPRTVGRARRPRFPPS